MVQHAPPGQLRGHRRCRLTVLDDRPRPAKLASTTIYHGIDDPDAVPTSLGPVAHHAITEWACQNKGRALWKVGDRQFRVQTVLHPAERALFDTNEALAGVSS